MNGILNVLKPVGMTSFDVVALVRKWSGVRRVGHTGTLDPDAVGVLTVCIGRATRVVEALTEKNKDYRVEMRLGMETDTQDATGNCLSRADPVLSETKIRAVLATMLGERQQVPPMYSAVKVGGRKLYELARKGQEVERKPRSVQISSCDPISFHLQPEDARVIFDVACSKGTYVRTICSDIGHELGCGGHMSFLLRLRNGPYSLTDAYPLEVVSEAAFENRLESLLLKTDTAFPDVNKVRVSSEVAGRLLQGQIVHAQGLSSEDRICVYDGERFLGLGSVDVSTEGIPSIRLTRQM